MTAVWRQWIPNKFSLNHKAPYQPRERGRRWGSLSVFLVGVQPCMPSLSYLSHKSKGLQLLALPGPLSEFNPLLLQLSSSAPFFHTVDFVPLSHGVGTIVLSHRILSHPAIDFICFSVFFDNDFYDSCILCLSSVEQPSSWVSVQFENLSSILQTWAVEAKCS